MQLCMFHTVVVEYHTVVVGSNTSQGDVRIVILLIHLAC